MFRRIVPPKECVLLCGETFYPDPKSNRPQKWCSGRCQTNYKKFRAQKNFIPLLPGEGD